MDLGFWVFIHMTPYKSWFEEFTFGKYEIVYFGDNKSYKIVEIGTIRLKLHDGMERVLKDVRLVTDLKRNLISVRMLDDKGFLFKIENGAMKFCKGSMVVIRGNKSNGIHTLEGITANNTKACVLRKHVNETEVWHKRLGHVSERGLVKFGTGKRDTKGTLDYVHREFDLLCKKEGIARHKTVRKTPQRNGLAERFNRTILERVMCIVLGVGLPKEFWAVVVSTTAYLICLLTTLDFKMPDEVQSGKPMSYERLKVFRCVCYAHIRMRKYIISRDVTFNEFVMRVIDKPAGSQTNIDRNEIEALRAELEVEPLARVETETHVDHESDDSEDDSKRDDLKSYKLARDKIQREVQVLDRYGHADLIAY
uniref:Integrase catalytic domain-containing protein n=1 Tax=Cannabis sativa TaxID=3483 RepID=A0A803NKV9_CANSA